MATRRRSGVRAPLASRSHADRRSGWSPRSRVAAPPPPDPCRRPAASVPPWRRDRSDRAERGRRRGRLPASRVSGRGAELALPAGRARSRGGASGCARLLRGEVSTPERLRRRLRGRHLAEAGEARARRRGLPQATGSRPQAIRFDVASVALRTGLGRSSSSSRTRSDEREKRSAGTWRRWSAYEGTCDADACRGGSSSSSRRVRVLRSAVPSTSTVGSTTSSIGGGRPSRALDRVPFRSRWRQPLVADAARRIGPHPPQRHRRRVPVRRLVSGRFPRGLPLGLLRRGRAPGDRRERIGRGARDRPPGASHPTGLPTARGSCSKPWKGGSTRSARTGPASPSLTLSGSGPTWSPDGRSDHVLLGRHRELRRVRHVVERCRTGSGSRAIRPTTCRPRWSPDGTRIAFVSERHGNADLYVVDPDGSHERRLTTIPLRTRRSPGRPTGNGSSTSPIATAPSLRTSASATRRSSSSMPVRERPGT